MRKFYLLLITVFFAAISNAQVANYSFAASSGTYTALGAPTNVFTGAWDDNTAVSVPIGFTFTFNGVGYTTAFVHPNGYITFGSSTSGYVPISGGSAVSGVVSAYGRDLQSQNTVPLGSVDYQTTGGVFTVQWTNTRRYNSTTVNAERFEMQIQLFQTTNLIKLVYGTWTDAVNASNTTNGEVGLRGASGADFKNLSVLTGGNWATPAAGAVNTATIFYNESSVATKPASGQTYTFTPPVPCVTPANQPTSLVLTPGVNAVVGSFTAAAGSPSGYLVIRTTSAAPPSAPVDGTVYTPGTSALGGVIVASGSSTNFIATGLSSSTTYYFWVYSYNDLCIGAPFYRTASPLTQSTTTTASCTITGTKTVGPTGNYPNLTFAGADLFLNGFAGPVILELQPTYTSVGEIFPLTIFALPCMSAVNTLTIRPQAGAVGLVISSANTTGTINFDGGDYVTIDGRAGGVGPSQLTISNTSATGYAVQLINSATFNTIKFCTVSGVNTGTTSGVIVFNNAVGSATGNSNNTIDNCDIKDGATTPTHLIYCSGNTVDYGSGNNNITISNCSIHDWFNASSTTPSAAINIVQGASDWTITANSFYQSVARTFTMTTATEQGAIFVAAASFGVNFNITNNFIGGTAPLCAGGPWTWTGGATGTPTPRLIRFSAANGPVNNITGNTVANMALTTSSISTSSGLIEHLNGHVNLANNTFGSQSATGNITFTLAAASVAPFFVPLGFGFGAVPANINVDNNNIGGITVSTTGGGAVSFRVIYGQPVLGSVVTINNNSVGGTIANSIQQLTGGATASNGSLFGILMLNPSVGNIITNNTVRNLTITNTAVGPSLTGINDQASGGGHTITGNTVFNLTTNSTNIANNNASSVVGVTMTGTLVGGGNISGNTIYNLTNTNATVAGWVHGMTFATAAVPQPTTIVSKNFIHSLNLSSATGGMSGIFSLSTGPFLVYNNMIRLGIDATGTSITTSLQINGILKGNTGMSTYFNTVYIGGTGVTSGAVNTYAYRRTFSGTLDSVMNNIFYNARSNASGTGKHYAISLNAATAMVSNYNDLFVNGTGGVLAVNGVTDYATLALWRTATNLDWSSVSSDPQLLNPTGSSATVDLHINPAVATAVEQGGVAIPQVADDFDAQSRAALTPTDIGADAGNFILLDQSPPVITYTPFGFTCATGDRLITGVTITDATGVPTAGALRPRIYYRKNAGAYFSQPGTLSSGSATNGQWSFTIVAADMGGLVAGDVVGYYIIAQDIVGPFIASNPAGAVATDVNTVTTPPTPNTYTITGSIVSSGTYNVGAAQTFTTITAAVAAYNSACLTGPVVFLLTDAAYAGGETFPISINANPYASATNTLTIKPSLAGTTITGSAATALILLNGADYVTINGSISATANTVCPPVAASRDLTITNTNTGTTSAVIWMQNTAVFDAATNNSVINCNLVGNSNTTTLFGVGSGSTTIATTSIGVNNNNNSIINNNISKTQYGIFSQGNSLATKNQGTVINQNLINTVAPNNTARGGIIVGFENSISISGNTISEISSTQDIFGIALGGVANIATTLFTGNEVTNATVTKNIIGSVRNTGNSLSACGIFVATALSGTNLIANNMISGVSGNPTPNDLSVGILLGGGNGSTTRVYYNTVTMTNVNPLTGSTHHSYALAVGGTQPNPVMDIRNNILTNTQNNGSGNNYAIGYGYVPFTNLTSDHNDYYVAAGATFFTGATGSLSAPTNQLTVANLQAATGKDGNAQNVLPNFVSATDLHLQTDNNCALDGTGIAVSVTDDIDCQTRVNFDLGADEFVSTFIFVVNNPAAVCSPATVDITVPAVTAGSTAGITFTYWTDAAATIPLANPNAIAVSGTYYIKAVKGNCISIKPVVVTVNPTPNAVATPPSQSICSGATITTIALTGAVSGTTFNWTRDNTGTVTGIGASGSGDISGSLTNTTNAPITVTFTITPTANGCPGTPITATVTVNPIPNAVATPPSQSICSGPITTIVLTGNVGGTVYNWTRDNTGTVTGIAANGSGNISGSLTNTTAAPITVTFTITPTANGCPGTPITATVTVNPVPSISSIVTQPSTCVSADGAIDITVSGSAGPYTYSWSTIGGSGLVPGVQDQSGLTVGQYTVIVTDGPTGCQQTAVYNLTGPGGCSICPVIGSVTTSPTPAVCAGNNVTITASGLTFMGVTYGITFKYSATALADPYVGGTVIATVPNGGLGGGGTTATTITTFPAGAYYIYAILSPTPSDPFCRPSAVTNLTVNPNPTVNPIASQTFCNGTVVPTGTFNFSSPTGSFAGKILLAYADSQGPPTQLRNDLLALPGVTQVDLFDAAAGTPTLVQMQQYDIVVPFSNSPYFDPVAMGNNLADYVDANGLVVGLGFTFYISPYTPTGRWVTGNYSPYTSSTNLDATPHTLGTYNAGHPLMAGVSVLSSNFHNVVPLAPGATEVAQWNNGNSMIAFKGRVIGITAYIGAAATWSGDFAKVIRNAGTWMSGGGIVFNWTNSNTAIGLGASGTGTSLPTFTATNAGTAPIAGTISVTATSIGGCTGPATTFTITVNPVPTITPVANLAYCHGSPVPSVVFSSSVPGTVFTWSRTVPSPDIGLAPTSGSGNVPAFTASNPSPNFTVSTFTVNATYTNNGVTCTSAPIQFTISIYPTPVVNPVPNQTVCNGAPTAPVIFSSPVSGTAYNWTNNTPSIGLAASGSGNIASFIAINPGTLPVVATITVTPVTGSGTVSQTFNFTGAVQTWVVPAGVTSVDISAFGGQGNANAAGISLGGLGGFASGTLAVVPGQTLFINVGGGGTTSITGGFNGGGNAGTTGTCLTAPGGGGGGASDVRQAANTLAARRIVAGGGGGTAGNRVSGCARGAGGGGGGGYFGGGGGAGYPGTAGIVPTGGTQLAGGSGGITGTAFGATNGLPGTSGVGGAGGNEIFSAQIANLSVTFGSGVGGGNTGGPGQQSGLNDFTGQSGAGGSSYTGGVSAGVTLSGQRSGNGLVTISYSVGAPPVICTGSPITFTITVNPAPRITCPPNMTVNSTPGSCGAIVNYPPAVGIGPPPPVITYNFPPGSFFPVGTTTVIATATNACGTATCSFTITVVDNQPPTIICPANIVRNNDPGLCSAVVTYPLPTVTDNCPNPLQFPASFAAHGGGTVFSLSGNTLPGGLFFTLTNNSALPRTVGSFGVRFGDPAFGPVNAPQTLTVWSRPGGLTAAIENSTAGWTQQGPQVVNPIPPYFPTGTGPLGICGLNSSVVIAPGASASFFIHGQTACPIFNYNFGFSPPITNGGFTMTGGTISFDVLGSGNHFNQGTANGIANIKVNYTEGIAAPVLIAGLPSGSVFPVGVTTNTYRATDAAGNTATCSFTVTVVDAQGPTITCPANIVRNTDPGLCTASIATPNPTINDNCGVTQLTWVMTGATTGSSPATGINFVGTRIFNLNGTTGQGVTTIVYTARDASGNITTCSFTVTVNDLVLPVITLQPATKFVCVGSNAVFTVTAVAGGGPIAYQWQTWDGTAWVNIAGATTNTLTVPNISFADNTKSYRVVLTGSCSVVISNAATLYVNPLPTVSLLPSIPPALLPAQFLTLTAIVSPTGGTFEWFKDNVLTSHTGSTWSGLTVNDIGVYKVRYTDPNGCQSTSADLAVTGLQSGNLWVYPNPNTGHFQVRFFNQLNEEVTLRVFDSKGAKVYERKVVTGTAYTGIDVDLSPVIAAGVYIVDVRDGSGRFVGARKIVVRHP